MTAGLMLLLGILARETAGQNHIIWTVLLCGAALLLDVGSNRRTKKRKIVILLLFSCFLFGVFWSMLVEYRREKAERPFRKALYGDGRERVTGDEGEAKENENQDVVENTDHTNYSGDSVYTASDSSDTKIRFRGEIIKVKETAYGMQLYIRCGAARVLVEQEKQEKSYSAENTGKIGADDSATENLGKSGKTGDMLSGTIKEEQLDPGEYVTVEGNVTLPEGARNPGGYDARETLRVEGITYVITGASVQRTGKRNRLRYGLMRLSARMERSLYRVFPEREASILAAMLLGERAGMDRETKLLYQKNGMAHILAISGMHVALLAAALRFIFQKLRLRRKTAAWLVIFILPAYAVMTGLSVPVIRAMIMLMLRELAVILDRTEDMPTSMVLSLVILAVFRPWAVFSAGLLMSFAAVSAVLFGGVLSRQLLGIQRLRGLGRRKRKLFLILLPGLVSVLLLNLFMLPLLLYFYYEFPLYSMLLNLLVIPLMSFLVAGGFAAALLGLLPGRLFLWIARMVGLTPYLILRVYEWLCRTTLRLPFALINPGHASFELVVISYGLVILLLVALLRKGREEKFARKRFCLFLVGTVGLFIVIPFSAGWLNERRSRAVFLDVGQGDSSICHVAGGPNLIIDCGSGSDSVGQNVLVPALKYYGMSDVDAVFVSHTDRDHTIGLLYLLENADFYGMRIRHLIFAEGTKEDTMMTRLLRTAESCGAEVVYVSKGDCLTWENCEAEVLYPAIKNDSSISESVVNMKGEKCGEDSMGNRRVNSLDSRPDDSIGKIKEESNRVSAVSKTMENTGNDYSLVFRLDMAGLRILYTGDISSEVEKEVLQTGKNKLQADILKCPHHGSKYSSSSEFLEVVSPDYTIISCGRNNMYGHPAQETLERLHSMECEIYRTDLQGGLIIEN